MKNNFRMLLRAAVTLALSVGASRAQDQSPGYIDVLGGPIRIEKLPGGRVDNLESILEAEGVKCLALPARSPNLNAFAERWVRSVKQECLRKLIFFGETSLRRALTEYICHFHSERNHQGKGNVLLFPEPSPFGRKKHPVRRVRRLGGLLNFYGRAA